MKYKAAVVTVSDSCFYQQREDLSGAALAKALESAGLEVTAREIVPDDLDTIAIVLQRYVAQHMLHLILTTGGTGFGPRDVTPEATREVIEKPAPGVAELLRQSGLAQTQLSWLSRGVAGIAKDKLIINLPGNPKAMESSIEALKPILFHALDLLNGGKPH
jgi:molybdopterin adenylyltransferase